MMLIRVRAARICPSSRPTASTTRATRAGSAHDAGRTVVVPAGRGLGLECPHGRWHCCPGRRPFTCTVYPACACSWRGSQRVPPRPSPLRSRRRPSQNAGRACSPAPNWVSTFPNSTTSTTGGSSSPANASIRSARCLMRARGITWATMPPLCAQSAARSRSMSTRSTTPGPFEPSWSYRKGPTSLRWTKSWSSTRARMAASLRFSTSTGMPGVET